MSKKFVHPEEAEREREKFLAKRANLQNHLMRALLDIKKKDDYTKYNKFFKRTLLLNWVADKSHLFGMEPIIEVVHRDLPHRKFRVIKEDEVTFRLQMLVLPRQKKS